MEFNNNKDQITDDEEDEDEMDVPYESSANSLPLATKPSVARYRECLKNHAIAVGGHAVDGCGEFLPSGEDGTIASLKCAACNCHRNFHRKETDGERPSPPPNHHNSTTQIRHQRYRTPPPAGNIHNHNRYFNSGGNDTNASPTTPASLHRRSTLALPAAAVAAAGHHLSRGEQDVMSNPSSSGGGCGSSRKRHRTKFTAEQKDKMLGLAERLGWRIQKHDEAYVEQFCQETSIKRNVLKVWMHNNKHTLGKKPI